MKNQALIFLIVGLVVGISGTTFAMKQMQSTANKLVATNVAPTSSDSMPSMDMSKPIHSDSSMSMAEMTSQLSGLTGDNFDKMFISYMIAHHQGAIGMAKMAAAQAKHQEIKDLANNIVSAQTAEIIQMQAWQKTWGY